MDPETSTSTSRKGLLAAERRALSSLSEGMAQHQGTAHAEAGRAGEATGAGRIERLKNRRGGSGRPEEDCAKASQHF